MNFDDRIRIIHDIDRVPVELRIGSLKEANLDDHTLKFIRGAMKTHNDPLVVLAALPRHPPEVLALMTLLQDLDTGDYDDVLRRCIELMGADNVGGPRPSRQELRFKLRVIAQTFAAGVEATPASIQKTAAKVQEHIEAEREQERRDLEDNVDPDQLDEDLRKQREADRKRQQDKTPLKSMDEREPPSARDRMDAALGIAVGASTDELAAALADKAADPDAFDPATARRQKAPSKKAGAKGAKKAAPKRTAVADKRSPPAKKPLGRIKA